MQEFRPTGPFLASLIILITYLVYFLFFKVMFLYMNIQVMKMEKYKRKIEKIREKIVLQSGWNGLSWDESQSCRKMRLIILKINRAGYLWYFFIFSLIKKDFLHFLSS